MILRRTCCAWAAAIAVVGMAVVPARAVVVGGPVSDYSTYNAAPTSDFPSFNYVGTMNGASGVYLGNGYVITAGHVGPGNFTLKNYSTNTTTTYSRDTSFATVQLQDPFSSDKVADLVIFRLAGTLPNLRPLTIAPTIANSGTSLYFGGNGLTRGSEVTGLGYNVLSSNSLHFGANTVVGPSSFSTTTTNIMRGFRTLFDSTPGSTQAINGDSGGGVFSSGTVNGQNILQGIMLAINTLPGQPGGTVYYGDTTYAADLSYYRSQINAIVPEPAMLGFLGVFGLLSLQRKRAQRS